VNHTSDMRSILVYPSIIADVIIRVPGVNIPLFISKIVGKAQHFIEKMESIHLDLLETLIDGFLRPFSAGSFGVSDKAWFIKNLECKKVPYSGVVVFKTTINAVPIGIILYKKDGSYWRIESELPVKDFKKVQATQLDEEQYKKIVTSMHANTIPSIEALKEATGGNELVQMIKEAFNDFMASL